MRTSCHVAAHTEKGPVHIQIDTGPDFRQQALRFGVEVVDAVFVTHHHFDHVVGMDDLRPFFFQNKTPAPVYATSESAFQLRAMFGYAFDRTYPGSSLLDVHETDGVTPFVVQSRSGSGASVQVTPVLGTHGKLDVVGLRIGGFGYLTDVNAVPEATIEALRGVEVLVLDGLRPEPHPTHLSFEEASDIAARIGARETRFVHMTHAVLHAEARLPAGVGLGFDGLVLKTGDL